jgi:hypothetical protein
MSVASKIRDTIAGVVPGADPETAAAIERVHAADALLSDLQLKEQAAAGELTKLERLEGQEALAAEQGDRSRYDKYRSEVEGAQEALRRLQAAIREAARQQHEAKVHLHQLGKRGQIKTAKRLTKMRADATAEYVAASAAEAKALERLLEINDKIAFFWPGGGPPAGALLGTDELMPAIAVERFRLLPRTPLESRPKLPGADSGVFLPAPKEIKPIATAMDEANSYLLRVIEQGPVLPDRNEAPEAAPDLATDPDAELLNVPEAPRLNAQPAKGRTFHADEVMAEIKTVQVSVEKEKRK